MRPADFRAMPRTNATATAMPTAADAKLWKASCVICEKYDITCSPTYDCQFVFVVNDADVSNDCRSVTAAKCCGLSGSTACSRSTRYVSSIDGDAEQQHAAGVPRPVLILVRVDAADAVDRALDRAEPRERAVEHAHEIDPERLCDEQHAEADRRESEANR